MKKIMKKLAFTATFFAVSASFAFSFRVASADESEISPPGVVIDKSPDFKKVFIGSPSFEILPDGTYVSSHDWFGSVESAATGVFESKDRGATWTELCRVEGIEHSVMFYNNDALWLIGLWPDVGSNVGSIAICRSNDGGKTWTEPKNLNDGFLLRSDDETKWFCDPAPVAIHHGRVWKELELYGPIDAEVSPNWATGLQPLSASAPADANLLDSSVWTFSNTVRWPRTPGIGGWLEGNSIVTPEGEAIIQMRVDDQVNCGQAAIVHVSADGKTATFDQEKDMIAMPGGAKKFTVRYDEVSKKYWALVNWVHPNDVGVPNAERVRNTLALVCSENLRDWEIRTIVLRHKRAGYGGLGFQYCDWRTDGDDLVFACRTAWLGSPNSHDANYLTFHRLKNFRELTREDDAETME